MPESSFKDPSAGRPPSPTPPGASVTTVMDPARVRRILDGSAKMGFRDFLFPWSLLERTGAWDTSSKGILHLKMTNAMRTIGIVALAGSLAVPTSCQPEEIAPGDPVPAIQFEHAYGKGAPKAAEITLAERRGRVLILEFWATW